LEGERLPIAYKIASAISSIKDTSHYKIHPIIGTPLFKKLSLKINWSLGSVS